MITDKRLLTETEAADFLGFSTKTLQKRRWLRQPPKFVKLGRSIRYRIEDLESYVARCAVQVKEA